MKILYLANHGPFRVATPTIETDDSIVVFQNCPLTYVVRTMDDGSQRLVGQVWICAKIVDGLIREFNEKGDKELNRSCFLEAVLEENCTTLR
jgi:hypothetical protein